MTDMGLLMFFGLLMCSGGFALGFATAIEIGTPKRREYELRSLPHPPWHVALLMLAVKLIETVEARHAPSVPPVVPAVNVGRTEIARGALVATSPEEWQMDKAALNLARHDDVNEPHKLVAVGGNGARKKYR